MDIRESTIDATTDDGEMAVVISEPVSSPIAGAGWPAVLVFIDAPGIRPATREFMGQLAAHGYKVITPDLHHRHGRLLHYEPADTAADPSAVKTIWKWIASMTDDQIQHDGHAALAASGLAASDLGESSSFATIGFCLGARAAYRMMERNPDRVVCGAGWHPSFLADDEPDSPHLTAGNLTRPLYLGIGEADNVQPIAMHQPFLDAVADLPHVEVATFEGADHGFTWPGYPTFHQVAAETSWAKTLAMLSSSFGSMNR